MQTTTVTDHPTVLTQRAARAFAEGRPVDAGSLLRQARETASSSYLTEVGEVLAATFSVGWSAGKPDVATRLRVAELLRAWGQAPAAFSVLAANFIEPAHERIRSALLTNLDGSRGMTALALLADDDPATAVKVLVPECARLQADGLEGVETHARTLLAQSAQRVGNLTLAESALARARVLAATTDQPAWGLRADLVDALVAALRGEGECADAIVRFSRQTLSSDDSLRQLARFVQGVGMLGVERWSDAYDILNELWQHAGPGEELRAAGILGYLAEAAVHCGRKADASTAISTAAAEKHESLRGAEVADLAYACAVLAPAESVDTAFRFLDTPELGAVPWVHARARFALGATLRRQQRVAEARPHLLAAEHEFAAIGAIHWKWRAASELRAAGVPSASPLSSAQPAATLSAQELEIARLVACGLSNREIGQRLRLSPRTIGSHLYRIFPKLDVTSRTQLAGMFAAH